MIPKVHKYYNLGIQLTIGLIAYTFLFRQLFYHHDLSNSLRSLSATTPPSALVMGFVLLVSLMLLNWGIEAYKWKILIRPVESVNLRNAVLAVFTGVTVSFFTPNRTGEFLGRIYVLPTASRWKSAVLTLLGSMSQLLITIIVGSIALFFFLTHYTDLLASINPWLTFGIVLAWLALLLALIPLWFMVKESACLPSEKGSRTLKMACREGITVLREVPGRLLTQIIALSLIRYIVFTLQALLLLELTGTGIALADEIILVPVVFLVLTAIPTIAVSELGVRGSVAVFLFSFYQKSNAGYMSDNLDVKLTVAFSLLWIINIALPAIIGSAGLSRLHVFRNNIT